MKGKQLAFMWNQWKRFGCTTMRNKKTLYSLALFLLLVLPPRLNQHISRTFVKYSQLSKVELFDVLCVPFSNVLIYINLLLHFYF